MTTQREKYGYVYILKNDCMPDLIKIGRTEQEDFNSRISALNSHSGVPVPFKVVHVSKVKKEDCKKLEKALHDAFATDRENPKREFFRMEAERAIAFLRYVEIEDVTEQARHQSDEALAPLELEARGRAEREAAERVKRPKLRFADLGISVGEHIYWRDDTTKYVTVADDNLVIFEGSSCSLSAATSKLLGISYNVQPSPYWLYDGKPLIVIYNEKYPPQFD